MTRPTTGTSRRTIVGALGLGSLGLAAPGAPAAVPGGLTIPPDALGTGVPEIYLVVDGITGDSTDKEFRGAIELLALDWSVKATRTATGSGSGTGKTVAGDVEFAARSSSASPKLLKRLASGRMTRRATVHVMRRGDNRVTAMTLDLKDVLVTGYEVMSSSGLPIEVVSLAMSVVTETWIPQNADGSLGTPVSVTWDLRTGRVS